MGDAMEAIAHRGPDASRYQFWQAGGVRESLSVPAPDVSLGHTRLAIIDPENKEAEQPFRYGDTTVTFNGEIWNYQNLRIKLESEGLFFSTESDTEVLAAALDYWGQAALPKLQGMFAIAWTPDDGEHVYLARDRFGEVPLHYTRWGTWASEIKALFALLPYLPGEEIKWVEPGEVIEITGNRVAKRRWYFHNFPRHCAKDRDEAASYVRMYLEVGVNERTISDVPVCTLLSGGIDSAAVALIAKRTFPDLVAYTAVLDEKAKDLRMAREMAEFLEIPLVEVLVEPPTAYDLEKVVQTIEMPHKAQVEIGWACLKLAERMRSDGFKVTYSGEGSDELWASYGMAYHGIKQKGWYDFRRDLFVGQHRKNFARCNKVFMAHSIECRLPFLSTRLVEYALGLPQHIVQEVSRPKAVIQDAFRGLLPDGVTDRPKVAFQDGMGLKKAIAGDIGDPKALYSGAFKKFFPAVKA